MFDLRRIPIIRALLPFAAGVLSGFGILEREGLTDLATAAGCVWMMPALILIWILLCAAYRFTRSKAACTGGLFFFIAFVFFYLSGLSSNILSKPVDPGLPVDQKLLIRGEITEGPSMGKKTWRYGMNVWLVFCTDSVLKVRTHFKVYLPAPQGSEADAEAAPGWNMPQAGETWQLYGHLVAIRNNGNPGEPDYRAILGRKNCWYRFFTDSSVDPGSGSVSAGRKICVGRRLSRAGIRSKVSGYWNGDEAELSLLKALCLGDRSDLSDDLKQSYSHAGAMHLLAVSGLHMGLIWWVLYRIFSWMTRISGNETYRSVAIIALLWMFAYVSGFSSSVSRSATMLTLFTAGRLMDQRLHALNGIFVSAFLLILIRPGAMLDVGFQLSYTAMTGIVCLYPALRARLNIRNRMLRWIWEASLVSISAQVSTAPLVIHYFHQIPVYSLLSSLLAIPLLSILISIFVVSVPFTTSGIGCDFFNALLTKLAYLMNLLVDAVASIPGAVIGELNLSTYGLCIWMALLLMGMIMLNHRSALPRYLMLLLVSMGLCRASVARFTCLHSSAMIISHFNNASMLTFREGDRVDHYCWYRDSAAFSFMSNYLSETWNRRNFQTRIHILGDTAVQTGLISTSWRVAPGIWFLGNDHCRGCLVSGAIKTGKSDWQPFSPELSKELSFDFVLLSDHPPPESIPWELLSCGGELILDGSNRSWYSLQLERNGRMKSMRMNDYATVRRGAYLKRW